MERAFAWLCKRRIDYPDSETVKSYYASNDHAVLLALVHERIADPLVLDLVGQYL